MADLKYGYCRDELLTSFDVGALLDAGRPETGRRSSSSSGESMASRVREIRRKVGVEGMSLEDARALDFDAYAESLPRLRSLRQDYLSQPENQPVVGEAGGYRKASVLVAAPKRTGKDAFLDSLSSALIRLAALAGLIWSSVKPSSEHSPEDIGQAQIVHHEDLRFRFTRSYEDALRYLDPNQASRQAARNSNMAAVAPRAILISTSETPEALALTMKARRDSHVLADEEKSRSPLDVDEFLFRLGFVVEIEQPNGIHLNDLDATTRDMLVKISRVEHDAEARTEVVRDRIGHSIGSIRTQHRMEPFAVIQGCDPASRFLAMEILESYSPDVWSALPIADAQTLRIDRLEIEKTALEEQTAREAEAARVRAEGAARVAAITGAPLIAAHIDEGVHA